MSKYNDKDWMRLAYHCAHIGFNSDEVPVGSVVVSENNVCLGTGFNQVLSTNDPTAHAEIVALRKACGNLGNYRLLGATLYVTLEPCIMCAGALIHARIKRVVFASRNFHDGAAGTNHNLMRGLSHHSTIQIDEGLMADESAALLRSFFKTRRSNCSYSQHKENLE